LIAHLPSAIRHPKPMSEVIPIAADHAGFEMKQQLEERLKARGYEVKDLGTDSPASTDYADYAHPLADMVSRGDVKRGVLLCGTGLGMAYAANRHPHVRAAVVWSPEIAELARKHNDANVLVLPSRFLSPEDAEKILDVFLSTDFEGGRHVRRVEKIETEEHGE
jgi:ribose 5-phosphate isomerase B